MSLFRSLVLALFAVSAPLVAQDIEPQPAELVPLADESLILDITRAGERYVAVGERGHVLISRDGIEWEQAEQVPVQATLTRVDFAGGRLWAVGHDTTIIHSSDLGRTWSLQHFEPDWERPLLDVHFFNSSEGLAVGAYGLIMKTGDGGNSWESMDMVDVMTSEAIDWSDAAEAAYELADTPEDEADPSDEFYDASKDFDRGCYEFIECHLNAILVNDDGRIMLAGERGYGFRSSDRGETWESFRFPYPGSMFGLLSVQNDVLAFGLRGNVQRSSDFGDSWEVLDSGVDSTLLGGALDQEGWPVMVGSGATILTYHPLTGDFRVSEDRLGSDYAAVLFPEDGGMILAGEEGLKHE